MSEFSAKLKDVFEDGIRIVNEAATAVANSTRYKLDELDRISRRREAIGELGEKVYALYCAGAEMPEEALPLLTELASLEEGLQNLRTEYAEQKLADKQRKQEDAAARKEQRAAEKAARAAAKLAASNALADAKAAYDAAEEEDDEEEIVIEAEETAEEAEEAVEEAEEEEQKPDDMLLM